MSSIGGVGGNHPIDTTHPTDEPAAPASTGSTTSTSTPSRTTSTTSTSRTTTSSTTHSTTTTLLNKVAAGTLGGSNTQVTLDPATGKFASTTAGKAESDSTALYRAAELIANGTTAFLTDPKLGSTGKLKVAQNLESALKAGNGSSGVAKQADLQSRSGAATVALTMAKGLPEGDPVKGRLVAAYVAQMGVESQRGLKASMVMNLDDAVKTGKVKLTADQKKTLDAAREATFPSKPPYDSWFKNGNTLNMKHYIHTEFFDEDSANYEQLGFKKTVLGPGHYAFDKTYTDAQGKKMPVHVECLRVSDDPKADKGELPMKKIFSDMSDDKTQIEFYGGHSNLGGNVLGGLADGPAIQKGDKWVIDWMCRGKQVLADVYNKYPDAHYMTTNQPVYANGPGLLDDMFKGIANRQTYKQMASTFKSDYQSGSLIWPDDPAVLQVRDIDQDGQVDVGAKGVDPLWNTGLTKTSDAKRDLKPVTSTATPQDLQGNKIMRGVNFANTFINYHINDGPNDGRIPKDSWDHITAGGFFTDPSSNDLTKITERKGSDGQTYYDVAVNSKFANQETNAIGAGILYDLNKYLSIKKNGSYTAEDKMRGAVFAGEYCAYMAESYEQVDDIMKAVRDRYGFPSGLTWDNVNKAIDTDGEGYATPKQISALQAKIGQVDPRKG